MCSASKMPSCPPYKHNGVVSTNGAKLNSSMAASASFDVDSECFGKSAVPRHTIHTLIHEIGIESANSIGREMPKLAHGAAHCSELQLGVKMMPSTVANVNLDTSSNLNPNSKPAQV